ncbi:MAG: hypothetical protein KDI37_01410 [Xanthomonadales bacterium]|nr:hypothetical protein [Xanthomonadales bacterium]MCB1640357.1 hypothetical protein [Xanthomonadales bacterium]
MKSSAYKRWLFAAACLPVVGHAGTVATPTVPATTTIGREVQRDVSPPLRDLISQVQDPNSLNPTEYVVPNVILDVDDLFIGLQGAERGFQNVQRFPSGSPTPAVGVAVNGMRIGLGGGGVPPDTTGDVGPNHFFQWVNTSWALFDKNTGAIVDIPGDPDDVVPGNSFFAGFGGLCQTTNRGDPLVLWDGHARRWVVSQFAFTSTSAPPFLQCVAVSTSEDPLGSYNRYAFQYPSFNDYGKMAVWVTEDGGQDAYVFTQHEFGAAFEGASFSVMERDQMLAGGSAQFVRVAGLDAFGVLPFHLEGDVAMPPGACPMFAHFIGDGSGYRIWDFCVDWAAGTTNFTDNPTILASDPYVVGLNGIGQVDSTTRLDDFGGNSMYVAAVRAFGSTGPQEAYGVINHSVNVGNFQAGLRWVQFGFRTPLSAPSGDSLFASGFEDGEVNAVDPVTTQKRIVDQGTYAPDADSRWMGGINIDRQGNIAVGYNVASEALNPQVRIAARLRTDPAGILRDETQCSPTTTGAQTGLFSGRARWGDYATMGVDPNDECTFWFTTEYYVTTSNSSWNTRICSLTLPGCGDDDFLLEVTPGDGVSVCAIDGDAQVSVRAGEFGTIGSNIALSAGTLPGGLTLSFTPSSIAAGESSMVDLVGSASLADGAYNVQIVGTAGPLNRSVNFPLNVSTATSPAPALQAPGDAATGVVPRPTYSWNAASGAVEYLIEVATDNGFTNIIDSATVTGTSYESGVLLLSNTEYFWRVTPNNFCGMGATSTAFSFTTGLPGTCPAGSSPVTVFEDDFQSGTNGWTTNAPVGPSNWTQVTPPAATNLTTTVWMATNPPSPDANNSSDQRLVSPSIVLPDNGAGTTNLFLRYDAFHSFEQDGPTGCWDGGQLEISTDGGANWTQILDSSLFTDPYTGLITVNAQNPNSGTPGWCAPVGNTSVQSIVDLNGFRGDTVQLRYRVVTDGNTAGPAPNGFFIDNVEVIECQD